MGTHEKTIATYNDPENPWLKGDSYAHTYLERPAMYSLLPELQKKSVLCVGFGRGEECLYLKRRGADRVVGIDIADAMVNHARRHAPGVEFYRMDMENISLPEQSFDLVYSSLALHYTSDWRPTLESIHRVLRADGTLVFSVHHPVFWSAYYELDTSTGDRTRILGFKDNQSKQTFTVFGDYSNIREIREIWHDRFEVVYYHKPFSSMLADIRESGLLIKNCIEPRPVPELSAQNAVLGEIWSKIPLFIAFELGKSP